MIPIKSSQLIHSGGKVTPNFSQPDQKRDPEIVDPELSSGPGSG